MKRPFGSELVLTEYIGQATLRAYHIGFDQGRFRMNELADVIRRVIPEFALGYYVGTSIPITDIVDRVQEAARAVYTTEKFEKRGEFGELILHLLLRDFCNTVPLISKMYFKDAVNIPIHGFDGVHVTSTDKKKLWLGESKLYKSGDSAINDLAKDIEKHVTANYLRKEFTLIKRKLPESFPDIEYWRNLMDIHQKLDEIYDAIVIPMIATYTSSLFQRHSGNTKDYFKDFTNECHKLHDKFRKKALGKDIEILLFLMPVADKDELNSALHNRLKAMQRI